VEEAVAALAGRQYGLVTRGQLRVVGVGDTGIRERLRTKRLHRLHRGVYAVGHSVLPSKAHWMAAVLACGDGAVLSHVAAAAHHQIRRSAASMIDVTVPGANGRQKRKGIRIHRSGRLGSQDVTVHEGIPVTTVARTLLDLADVLDGQALKRTIDEAEYLRVFDLAALIAAVHNNPGRRGAKLMAAAEGPPELTKSALEERFLALIERRGLPRPRVGVHIDGYEVDFIWPEANLIVELDGFAAHGTRTRFESDRVRDRRLARKGLQTMRFTANALGYDEDAIAEELTEAVSRSRASSNPSSRESTSPANAR
jgi:very-short-patch-repair endonuclease